MEVGHSVLAQSRSDRDSAVPTSAASDDDLLPDVRLLFRLVTLISLVPPCADLVTHWGSGGLETVSTSYRAEIM